MLMAALIQFFITYSLAMMAFWILEISTIVFIVYSFEYFLGGQMFPIDIMPSAVQAVMKWLPFYYELFCPIAIFLGRLKGPELKCKRWRSKPVGCSSHGPGQTTCGNVVLAITRLWADNCDESLFSFPCISASHRSARPRREAFRIADPAEVDQTLDRAEATRA